MGLEDDNLPVFVNVLLKWLRSLPSGPSILSILVTKVPSNLSSLRYYTSKSTKALPRNLTKASFDVELPNLGCSS